MRRNSERSYFLIRLLLLDASGKSAKVLSGLLDTYGDLQGNGSLIYAIPPTTAFSGWSLVRNKELMRSGGTR